MKICGPGDWGRIIPKPAGSDYQAALIQKWSNKKGRVGKAGGGGGTPLYKPYRDMPPLRVGFLRRLSQKTGIDFAHFGLESGTVFERTTGVYERICLFNSKWKKTTTTKKKQQQQKKRTTNIRIENGP